MRVITKLYYSRSPVWGFVWVHEGCLSIWICNLWNIMRTLYLHEVFVIWGKKAIRAIYV